MCPGENEIRLTCKQIDIDALCLRNAPAILLMFFFGALYFNWLFLQVMVHGREQRKERAGNHAVVFKVGRYGLDPWMVYFNINWKSFFSTFVTVMISFCT